MTFSECFCRLFEKQNSRILLCIACFRIGLLREQLDMKCCQISPWIKFLSLERHGSFCDLRCTVLDISFRFLCHTILFFIPFCPTIIGEKKRKQHCLFFYNIMVITLFHGYSSGTVEERSLG